MRTKWKSSVAGILEIISGSLSIIIGCGLYMSSIVANFLTTVPPLFNSLLTYPSIPLLILGILSLTGGIYALRRKTWGLTLAGAIAAFFALLPLGIFAVIVAAISRKDYAHS